MSPHEGAPSQALDLLQAVVDQLRDELLPQMPVQQRYGALMVSHALGIVGRELIMTTHLLDIERGVLAGFVRPPDDPGDHLALDSAVLGLRRRLVAGLRSGELDGQEAALLKALRSLVRLRCSIDSPKASK